MRLTITLSTENQIRLPLHYNYLVQSLIYGCLESDFASFLHNTGYEIDGRRFKLFTFSRLIGRYRISEKEICFEPPVRLIVSSPNSDFCSHLLNGLLSKKSIQLGDNVLEVETIDTEKSVVTKENLKVRLQSPVVVYSTLFKADGRKYTCYFQPGETEFANLIADNLRRKYRACYGQAPPEADIRITCLQRPRLHVVRYKTTVIKGYSGALRIQGPTALLQLAVEAGLGAKNSMGFGCCEIIED